MTRSIHSSLLLAATLIGGCAKQTPPTTHIKFDDDVIRVIRERPLEDVKTEPVPGDDLTSDEPAAEVSATPAAYFAAPAAAPVPWHCFGAVVGTTPFGECYAVRATCKQREEEWRDTGAFTVGCRTQPRAACFHVELVLHERSGYRCHNTFDSCNQRRQLEVDVFGDDVIVGRCEARRVVEAPPLDVGLP